MGADSTTDISFVFHGGNDFGHPRPRQTYIFAEFTCCLDLSVVEAAEQHGFVNRDSVTFDECIFELMQRLIDLFDPTNGFHVSINFPQRYKYFPLKIIFSRK